MGTRRSLRRAFEATRATLLAVLAVGMVACGDDDGPSPTPTATASATRSATAPPSPTLTHTATASATVQPTATASRTPSPTASATATFTASATATSSPSASPTDSPSATPTLPADTPTASPTRQAITVHLDQSLGAVNPELLGVGWNTGRLEDIAPFAPTTVRIDAHLPAVSPDAGTVQLASLLDAVARVHAVGGEPLVILFPMPDWLGAPTAAHCTPPTLVGGPCSPELVAPADFDAWEELIADVVRTLATAPQPALRFESWNEPDLFIFWHDTQDAFFRTAAATHRAVARVAAETGLPIEIGGPAASLSSFGVGQRFIPDYVAAMVAAGQPIGFVSWHWYANYPFLGPDGNEGNVPDIIYDMIAQVNPDATPRSYTQLTHNIRGAVAQQLPPGSAMPPLNIDEWNLSAGGYDLRNDTHVGASFVAASLIEMERAGLDRANIYRSISGNTLPGDWGIVGPNGEHKPNWWVFDAFQQMHGERLAVEGDDPAGGLWARAVHDGPVLHILLSTFRATGGSGRSVALALDGSCTASAADRAVLDEQSATFTDVVSQPVVDGTISLDLGSESVTWLRLQCGTP